MSIILLFFILIALYISYVDIKKGIIQDKVILPSIIVLIFIKFLENSLITSDFIALLIVVLVFAIPIALNLAFGGGDLRFGAFSALFLGIEQIGLFIVLSGLIHLLILVGIRKKEFAFAPAMSFAAIGSYMIGVI